MPDARSSWRALLEIQTLSRIVSTSWRTFERRLVRSTPPVQARAQESGALFAGLGNRAMQVECLTIIAIARVFSGFPTETLVIGQEGLSIAREIENPWGQANCSYTMVFALIELGKFQEALALAQNGVAAARAAGHPPILVFNLSALGRAYRALGDLPAARAVDLEAHATSEKLHHPFVGELAAIDLCADYALAGEWAVAYQYARAASAVRKYERLYPGFTRRLETESFVRAGDLGPRTPRHRTLWRAHPRQSAHANSIPARARRFGRGAARSSGSGQSPDCRPRDCRRLTAPSRGSPN